MLKDVLSQTVPRLKTSPLLGGTATEVTNCLFAELMGIKDMIGTVNDRVGNMQSEIGSVKEKMNTMQNDNKAWYEKLIKVEDDLTEVKSSVEMAHNLIKGRI